MFGEVREVELLAIREGTYTIYVFKDLNTSEFLMCTRLPRWQTPDITIGEKGFLNYKDVKAGETYFNTETETNEYYNYTNRYYMNFVKRTTTDKGDIIF